MMVYASKCPSVDHFPTDMDLYTFMFEYFPKNRPDPRGKRIPLLIDDETGKSLTIEDMHERADLLSLGMIEQLRSAQNEIDDQVIATFSLNTIDYPIIVWATHRLGGVISGANPGYTASELAYQL